MGSEGCEDKVKLLHDDPEAPPGVSLKKDDSKRSYSIWGITTSLVLSVLLIYVSWGTLMAFWDQNQKQPETILIDAESKCFLDNALNLYLLLKMKLIAVLLAKTLEMAESASDLISKKVLCSHL